MRPLCFVHPPFEFDIFKEKTGIPLAGDSGGLLFPEWTARPRARVRARKPRGKQSSMDLESTRFFGTSFRFESFLSIFHFVLFSHFLAFKLVSFLHFYPLTSALLQLSGLPLIRCIVFHLILAWGIFGTFSTRNLNHSRKSTGKSTRASSLKSPRSPKNKRETQWRLDKCKGA